MDIISVINYKGGVGKTTITANLASELAFREYDVLCIDLDPQASLTFSFIDVDLWKTKYEKNRTIKNWYDAFLDKDLDMDLSSLIIKPEEVNKVINGNVDLICSHLELINIDLELATRLVAGSDRDLRNNFLKVHSRLKQGLENLEEDKYDFVLIDCPPNFNIVTKNAITSSDYILVPTKPDYLSTLGVNTLDKHVNELVSVYNKHSKNSGGTYGTIDPEILGVIFTMISVRNSEPISAQKQYITQVKKDFKAFSTLIRENKTIYADAPEYGVPVVLKNVSGGTYLSVREELEQFTSELLNKLGYE